MSGFGEVGHDAMKTMETIGGKEYEKNFISLKA